MTELPKPLFVNINETFSVKAIRNTEDAVKVYKDSGRIKIGDEIQTSIRFKNSSGEYLNIPLCLNCLARAAVGGLLCSICRDLEVVEDSIASYCENDLINTNAYKPK